MKKLVALILIGALGAGLYGYYDSRPGKITGGQAFHIPDWFKVSFLEIKNDAKEAAEAGKHLLLYMHMENCPYCKRMLEESFIKGRNKEFIEKHFDVIDINIRGSRIVEWDSETTYSEKAFAQDMKVYATPTLVFLNGKGHIVFRTNGYRTPDALRDVMQYVNDRQYNNMSLAEYVAKKGEVRYQLKEHPVFESMKDFSNYDGPIAVIFEDPGCSDCAEFHEYTLQHPDVLKEMQGLKVVRLNAWSDEPIIDNNGNQTTPRKWARALELDYRPGTVLFDGGIEVTRADGQYYHFHYKEMLRYVAKGLYFKYPTYLLYLSARQRQLIKEGVDIDLGR